MTPASPPPATVPLRAPDKVMRLERMGSSFPTRLSFMRQLVRRMYRERWRLERPRFDLDAGGFGVAVYAAHGPERTYSLVCFTNEIQPEDRTDRVIAEVWDATFSLFDGTPGDADIERLRANTPRQEAGRFLPSELCLARGNKSVRLFEHVVDSLAAGQQPDADRLVDVGYLMRTTAVYGSGKYGVADRTKIADRPEMRAPFQAEMLTVYLVRWLTIDLVNHVARCRGGERAVELHADLARHLGIGNSTGLGMAPFLIKHPILIDKWVTARETALARVRSQPSAGTGRISEFRALLGRTRRFVDEWNVGDREQTERIVRLRSDLGAVDRWCGTELAGSQPWDRLYRHAEEHGSIECQELVVSLVLELHDTVVDALCDEMSTGAPPRLRPDMQLGRLLHLVDTHYGWALAIDYAQPEATRRFWYYSEEKLEPRAGDRHAEHGAELEMPIGIGRDIDRLRNCLLKHDPSLTVADLLVESPEHRHAVWRVQTAAHHPYGEIRDNLLGASERPIDILRFKLAFFGAAKFDPKSDLWTRVNMYQGAPLPHEVARGEEPEWIFPPTPARTRPRTSPA